MFDPIGVVSLHRYNRYKHLIPSGLLLTNDPKPAGEQWALEKNPAGSYVYRIVTQSDRTNPSGSYPFIVTIAINIESLRDCY